MDKRDTAEWGAKYMGKPCKKDPTHIDPDTKLTERSVKRRACIACRDAHAAKQREKTAEYQREYHRNQRLNHPDRLKEYKETQESRGHTNKLYEARKKQRRLQTDE